MLSNLKIFVKNSFEIKLKIATEWLSDENSNNFDGERCVRNALEDATIIANKLELSQNDQLLDGIGIIRALLNNLCILTQEGKVRILIFFSSGYFSIENQQQLFRIIQF
jgi:hypothetical protein